MTFDQPRTDRVRPGPSGRGRTRVVASVLAALLVGFVALALVLPGIAPGPADAAPDGQALAEIEAQLAAEAEARAAAEAEGRAQRDALFAELVRREDGDPTALGEVDAPVVMISWADYLCPYCASYSLETEPELIARYVDAGLLRIEWRDFGYLSPASESAAVAARAAGEQGQFWAYQEALFIGPLPVTDGELPTAHLLDIAATLGLDTARFEADLASADLLAAVRADLAEGRQLGVTGTPTFLINGEPIVGAQPLGMFQDTIDRALERAGVAVP